MNKKKLGGFFAALAAVAAGVVASRGGSAKPPSAPSAPPASATYSLTVSVYNGDPAADEKLVGARVDSGPLHASTDGAGNVELSGLPAGAREVCAAADGFGLACATVTVPTGSLSLSLSPTAPPVVTLAPLSTDGPIFLQAGQPWRWNGVTAFQLLDRFAKGEDIGPFLDDFAGFNVLRVFLYTPVKDWGAAAWDSPSPEKAIAFLKFVEGRGFYVELVLLTDDDSGRIEPARRMVEALKAARPPNVILEAGNEPETHKAINTAALRSTLMASGFLVSSGNYEDSRHWYGHWIGFHSGRDAEWPRRAHDALDYNHGGGPNFPEEPALKVPAVCDEPIRPDQAGFNDADFRAYFGTCALLGGGGTYHAESLKYGRRPTADEKRIAAVVLAALDAFPADAPRGPVQPPRREVAADVSGWAVARQGAAGEPVLRAWLGIAGTERDSMEAAMTRDSIWFSWLTVGVSIATYLATGPSPATWDFQHWMQAVIAIGGIIAAKLGSSPLKHSDEANTVGGNRS